MSINDGGPAFPTQAATPSRYTGMAMRDYFAVNADIGDVDYLSVSAGERLIGRDCPDMKEDALGFLLWRAEYRARLRYIEADAMLKAREGGAA